jgi:hypothetical protein
MKTKEELEVSYTKLLILMQTQLELMDDFKGTKLYSKDIKFYMKKLEEAMEKYVETPISQRIDTNPENEESFTALQQGVRAIIDSTLEDIYVASGRTE